MVKGDSSKKSGMTTRPCAIMPHTALYAEVRFALHVVETLCAKQLTEVHAELMISSCQENQSFIVCGRNPHSDQGGAERMDDNQFDQLVQRLTVAPSRREAVAGLVAGALTSVGLTSVADAKGDKNKNQRKRKRRKSDRNGKSRDGGKNHHGRDEGDVEDEDKKKRRRRRRNRCKKVGRPCSKNKKCCSKFCDQTTGLCAKKPDS